MQGEGGRGGLVREFCVDLLREFCVYLVLELCFDCVAGHEGETALHVAAEGSCYAAVHCLMELGANAGVKDVRGRLPWQLAREASIVQLLRSPFVLM